MQGRGGVPGSQPMSTAVHRSPNKLRRSNFIFNLCSYNTSLGSSAPSSTTIHALFSPTPPPATTSHALFSFPDLDFGAYSKGASGPNPDDFGGGGGSGTSGLYYTQQQVATSGVGNTGERYRDELVAPYHSAESSIPGGGSS